MRQIILDFGVLDVFGFHIPLRIHGYGLMMVFGFLFGIWLAQRFARRAGENPDTLVQCGILSLVGGVIGARIAYVIEKWDTEFARAGIGKVVDITSGGLIYYGGVLLATVVVLAYLRTKRLPIRRYLDILAPTLMVGLAFGRAGCTLNGCCFGGPARADWPLAIRFPMMSTPLLRVVGDGIFSDGQSLSPPYSAQYADGSVRPDSRLLNQFVEIDMERRDKTKVLRRAPLPAADYHSRLDSDQLATMFAPESEAREGFNKLAGDDGMLSEGEWNRGLRSGEGFLRGSEQWTEATSFKKATFFNKDRGDLLAFENAWEYLLARRKMLTDRFDADSDGQLTGNERAAGNEYLQADLNDLVARTSANPLKPAQPLGIINALILAALLAAFHRIRRREGQVFALLMILYPITRFILESIRADNPHDLLKGVLTHNQWTSLATVAAGVIMVLVLRKLPASAGASWTRRTGAAGRTGGNERGKPRRPA